ncbi:MAG: hypothetical protein HPY85_00460 [Anaerolineae bacterium]|nr:hypothetical protein [Anaerolineae bacterium]
MNWLEMVGFVASAVVAVSLMMRNVFWLRVINMVGAVVFTVYGLLIRSYPVAVMNGFVTLIDLYYLSQSFRKDYFKVLEVDPDGYYLRKFLSFYRDDISKFMPEFTGEVPDGAGVFFVLRNMVPAGLLITETDGEGKLWVRLDYAIPDYRDRKLSTFFYSHQGEIFDTHHYNAVYCKASTRSHQRYLRRMGFEQTGEDTYRLALHHPVHRKEKDLVM